MENTDSGAVPSLASPDRGFVADIKTSTPARRIRRKGKKGALLIALGLVSVIAILALAPLRHSSPGATDSTTGSSTTAPYQFRVYAMNTTMTVHLDSGTVLFVFKVADLPYELGSLFFGDFRADRNRTHVYYAGSGILVNATGASATVTLRESNGKVISSAVYHGQEQIVFNGEVKSVTYPKAATAYSGTDQMIQDWRNGAWSPAEGILVDHPANVTVLSASFFVMTIEPQGAFEIPEFPSKIVGLAIMTIIALTALRSRTSCKGDSPPPSQSM